MCPIHVSVSAWTWWRPSIMLHLFISVVTKCSSFLSWITQGWLGRQMRSSLSGSWFEVAMEWIWDSSFVSFVSSFAFSVFVVEQGSQHTHPPRNRLSFLSSSDDHKHTQDFRTTHQSRYPQSLVNIGIDDDEFKKCYVQIFRVAWRFRNFESNRSFRYWVDSTDHMIVRRSIAVIIWKLSRWASVVCGT